MVTIVDTTIKRKAEKAKLEKIIDEAREIFGTQRVSLGHPDVMLVYPQKDNLNERIEVAVSDIVSTPFVRVYSPEYLDKARTLAEQIEQVYGIECRLITDYSGVEHEDRQGSLDFS